MMEQKLLLSPREAIAAPETKQALSASLLAGEQGEFEGYASLFNVSDLGNDIVLPGAFAQSLRRRGPTGIKMLWQHDAAQPIGTWLDLQEDNRGLQVRGRLNLDVARAREVYSLMREGAVDGLSIGFRAGKAVRDRKTGLRRLEQIDLWEISVVTFPMLPQARVNAVKRGLTSPGGFLNPAESQARAVKRAFDAAVNILR